VKRQSRCETKSIAPEQIETLIIQLSGRVRLLDSDIEAEEEALEEETELVGEGEEGEAGEEGAEGEASAEAGDEASE